MDSVWKYYAEHRGLKRLKYAAKDALGVPFIITSPPWALAGITHGLLEFNLPEFHKIDGRYVGQLGRLFVRHPDGQVILRSLETHCLWHCDYTQIVRTTMLDALKKAASKAAAKSAAFEIEDADFAKRYPTLYVFLAANDDGDGNQRLRSKVQIQTEGECWKACLMDPEGEASLWTTLTAPGKVFEALEKCLAAERPDWRKWNNARKKK